ncbi:unnamed protein product [Blepharisma stoltei]|uniref:EGF-like domain-containing protein n=1 Tax=Blepharisma stoltei TaxID=1481888 RepID=A0AAU9JFI0_9CILI|nr:unnamed protein product [Blepharisma stoltei]
MRIFAFIIVIPLAFSLSCYQMSCDGKINSTSSNCVEFMSDHYSLKPCSHSNYTCPHPSHISTSTSLKCEYWIDKSLWDASSEQDYYGYSVVGKGDPCDPYGLVSTCDRDKNLVCYCPYGTCTCVAGLKYGENCAVDSTPCIDGYICSQKICTLKYSVKAGQNATDERACATGGPLVINGEYFTCKSAVVTAGTLPKSCSTNNDCISADGTDYSTCLCGMNTDGQAYCKLHYSDEPMINWREAARDGDWPRQIYWEFMSVNYPYLQGNIPSCLSTTWRDYGVYSNGEPASSLSGSFRMECVSAAIAAFLIC